jgi:hypothetical protein
MSEFEQVSKAQVFRPALVNIHPNKDVQAFLHK